MQACTHTMARARGNSIYKESRDLKSIRRRFTKQTHIKIDFHHPKAIETTIRQSCLTEFSVKFSTLKASNLSLIFFSRTAMKISNANPDDVDVNSKSHHRFEESDMLSVQDERWRQTTRLSERFSSRISLKGKCGLVLKNASKRRAWETFRRFYHRLTDDLRLSPFVMILIIHGFDSHVVIDVKMISESVLFPWDIFVGLSGMWKTCLINYMFATEFKG
jgi:hypothetical protein